MSSKLIHIVILYIHLHYLPHSIIIIVKFANRKIKIREKPRLVLGVTIVMSKRGRQCNIGSV